MCFVVLCHYYGPICVNANIPFIMGGMVSSRTQGACIPHLSHFHHGGIRSALGSEVRIPDLLSDHWRFGKAPPCNPPHPPPPTKLPMQDLFTVQGLPCSTTDDLSCFPSCSYIPHSHIISFHFQFFFTSSFLCLSFTLIRMTVISLWVNLGLCKALSAPALSHPPNHVWYLRQPVFTLTKAPACGSMLYFLWMKGLGESSFLVHLWMEETGCLWVQVSCLFCTSILRMRKNIRLDLETKEEVDPWRRMWSETLWSPFFKSHSEVDTIFLVLAMLIFRKI